MPLFDLYSFFRSLGFYGWAPIIVCILFVLTSSFFYSDSNFLEVIVNIASIASMIILLSLFMFVLYNELQGNGYGFIVIFASFLLSFIIFGSIFLLSVKINSSEQIETSVLFIMLISLSLLLSITVSAMMVAFGALIRFFR